MITPAEVENKTFRKRFRGFDPGEARGFLADVAEQMFAMASEVDTLARRQDELMKSLEEYRVREGAIQETLFAVRRLADEIKAEARREAEGILCEARTVADRQLLQARDQMARLEEEISRLRLERDVFEDRVRQVAEEHIRLIEMRRQEGEVRDRLRILSRLHTSTSPLPLIEEPAGTLSTLGGRPPESDGDGRDAL